MIGGGRGGGFAVGAVGGLALALLLVGVVAYLPQSNQALQAGSAKNSLAATSTTCGNGCGTVSTPNGDTPATSSSSTVSSVSSATATMSVTESTTTGTVSSSGQAAGVANPSLSTSEAPPSGTTISTVTSAAAASTTATSIFTPTFVTTTAANNPSFQSSVVGTSTSSGPQRPSSLLTVLPGEGVGSVIATLSPILVGLLIAALVYGAYTRRQDASS